MDDKSDNIFEITDEELLLALTGTVEDLQQAEKAQRKTSLTSDEEEVMQATQDAVNEIIEMDLSKETASEHDADEQPPADQIERRVAIVQYIDGESALEIVGNYDPNNFDQSLDDAIDEVMEKIPKEKVAHIDVYGTYIMLPIETRKTPWKLKGEHYATKFKHALYMRLNNIHRDVYMVYDDDIEFEDVVAEEAHREAAEQAMQRNFEVRIQFKGLDYTERLPPMEGLGWHLLCDADDDVLFDTPNSVYGYCIVYAVCYQLATGGKPDENPYDFGIVRARLLAGLNFMNGGLKAQSLRKYTKSRLTNPRELSSYLQLQYMSTEQKLDTLERYLRCRIYLLDARWKLWRAPQKDLVTPEHISNGGYELKGHNVYLLSRGNHCFNVVSHMGHKIINNALPKKNSNTSASKEVFKHPRVEKRKVVYYTNLKNEPPGDVYGELVDKRNTKIYGGIHKPFRFECKKDEKYYQDAAQLCCIPLKEREKMEFEDCMLMLDRIKQHPLLKHYEKAMSAASFGFAVLVNDFSSQFTLLYADGSLYDHLRAADLAPIVWTKPGLYKADDDFVIVEIDQSKAFAVACYDSPMMKKFGIRHRGFYRPEFRLTKRNCQLTQLFSNAAFYYIEFEGSDGLFQVKTYYSGIKYPESGKGLYSHVLIEEALKRNITMECLYTYDSTLPLFNPLGSMMKALVDATNSEKDEDVRRVLKTIYVSTIGKLTGENSYLDIYTTTSREEYYRFLTYNDYYRRRVLQVGEGGVITEELKAKELQSENLRDVLRQRLRMGDYIDIQPRELLERAPADDELEDTVTITKPKQWRNVRYQVEYKEKGQKKLVHLHQQVLDYQKRSMYLMQRKIEENGGKLLQILTDAVFARVPRSWCASDAFQSFFSTDCFSVDYYSDLTIYSTNNYVATYEDKKKGEKQRGVYRQMTTRVDTDYYEIVDNVDKEYYDESVDELLKRITIEFHFGGAGTGKSYAVVEEYCALSDEEKRKWLLCSFKGMAAERISGATYHSTLLKPSFIATHGHLEAVVIDEISNTKEGDLYRLLQNCAKLPSLKRLVFIGDFAQIRPIGARLCLHKTDTWAKIDALVNDVDRHEYAENQRFKKSPAAFIQLQHMRRAILNNDSKLFDKAKKLLCEMIKDNRLKGDEVVIAFQNDVVNAENEAASKGQAMYRFPIIRSKGSGSFDLPHYLNSRQRLKWKNTEIFVGAKVIHCKNKAYGDVILRNGSQGKVLRVIENEDALKTKVVCDFIVGGVHKTVTIGYDFSKQPPYTDSIQCMPLELGYATTIDKSQGLTFDSVRVAGDLSSMGRERLYVALSRCGDISRVVVDEWCEASND